MIYFYQKNSYYLLLLGQIQLRLKMCREIKHFEETALVYLCLEVGITLSGAASWTYSFN